MSQTFSSYLWPALAWLSIFAPYVAAEQLVVRSDFPGGSGIATIDQQQRTIRLTPSVHRDRGWACWWYVKVDGLDIGETIVLDVGDAPWATPDRAAVSVDNKTWAHTQPGKRQGNRITYKHRATSDVSWFAWGPPFLLGDADRLVRDAAARCEHARAFELCRTRGGNRVPALMVGDESKAKAGIWIQARQHAWETGSSWVCRGLTEWATSDDPRAKSLRSKACLTIVPVMDVDNVMRGAGGKDQRPQDHNRDWSSEPHWHSVRAATSLIAALNARGRFDLFVDLHNPGAGSRRPFFYVPPRDMLSERGRENLDLFLSLVQLEMTGPLPFQGETQVSGPNYDKNWQKISKNWVAENTAEHVVAVTLETAWNTPHSTASGYETVGRELGQAIERYLRTR